MPKTSRIQYKKIQQNRHISKQRRNRQIPANNRSNKKRLGRNNKYKPIFSILHVSKSTTKYDS